MHARLDRGAVRLLTRTGLHWTHKYPALTAALSSRDARQACPRVRFAVDGSHPIARNLSF
jgi:ATP-dependent DNA ligase